MKLLPEHTESCPTQYYTEPFCLYQEHHGDYNLPKSFVEQMRWARALQADAKAMGISIVAQYYRDPPSPKFEAFYAKELDKVLPTLFELARKEAHLNSLGLTSIPPDGFRLPELEEKP